MFLKHPLRPLRFSFNRIHLQYKPPTSNINVMKFNIEKNMMNTGRVISNFNESIVNDDSNTLLIRKDRTISEKKIRELYTIIY
jgi:hypothetical protein